MTTPREVMARALVADAGLTWQELLPVAADIESALHEAGFVVLPAEPTEAMIDAATRAEGDGNLEADARNTYRAMVGAYRGNSDG